MTKENTDPTKQYASLAQEAGLARVAKLAVSNVAPGQFGGRKTVLKVEGGTPGEQVEVDVSDMLTTISHSKGESSATVSVPADYELVPKYSGTGEFATDLAPGTDEQMFTAEAAQRLTDKIVEAANLSLRTDHPTK